LVETRGRDVHFGIQLTAQDTTWERFAEGVRGIEDLGFDSIWTFDHLLASGSRAGSCFETLTTLSAMALLTRRARIGVLIAGVAYRDPVTLAKSAAQVDQMSEGRLEFSLGAAWAKREFDVYGLPFPPLAERYDRLDEALDLVKLLWTEPVANYSGRYYSVHDAPCDPKPVQQPFPPITVGGSGDGLLAVAAKHATRVNMQGTPKYCDERSRLLSDFCAKVGRNFDEIELSLHASVVLGPSRSLAEKTAASILAAEGQTLDVDGGRWLLGTPDEVRDQLLGYVGVGISHFVFGMRAPYDMEPVRVLREEVLADL
jgi:alkanesulfonate monooxygenase SsuD/methylene tetrahydromethanopterin reductase-like flavin-dependent oxidoreductase (luciferase family)